MWKTGEERRKAHRYNESRSIDRAIKVVNILVSLLEHIKLDKQHDALRINRAKFHRNFPVFAEKIGIDPAPKEEWLYKLAENRCCPAVEYWEKKPYTDHIVIVRHSKPRVDKGEILANAGEIGLPLNDLRHFEFLLSSASDFADAVAPF